ncbi:MAG: hypothetical protein ACSHX3_15865 [Litorimonas sp.]
MSDDRIENLEKEVLALKEDTQVAIGNLAMLTGMLLELNESSDFKLNPETFLSANLQNNFAPTLTQNLTSGMELIKKAREQ